MAIGGYNAWSSNDIYVTFKNVQSNENDLNFDIDLYLNFQGWTSNTFTAEDLHIPNVEERDWVDTEQGILYKIRTDETSLYIDTKQKDTDRVLYEITTKIIQLGDIPVPEVEEIPITGIHFNQQYFTIELGTPDRLLPVIEPENTTMDKTLTWTCSETATATVAQDGTVTGVGYNDTYYTTITATTVNGLSASYKLGVMPQGTLTPKHTHNWSDEWSKDASYHWHECTANNCTVTANSQKNGYAMHVFSDNSDTTCNVCGYVRTVEEHIHDYEMNITTEPTCTEPGVATYTCSCGHTYTEAISPGHSFEESEEIISTKDVCTQTIRSCTKCDYNEVMETNSTHKFRTSSEGEQLECRICGYDPGDDELEILTEPIVRYKKPVNKVVNNNTNKYSISLNYSSTRDNLNQTNTSDNIDIDIEIDTTKSLNTNYQDLTVTDAFGITEPITYTDKDEITYNLKYKLTLNNKALDIAFVGETEDNKMTEEVVLRLDDNFIVEGDPNMPDEPVIPINPDKCDCVGDYKILVEIKPATINQPAQYQYLSVNNKMFETASLKEGVDKYCKELDNYKRKQITLIDDVDVNIDLTIKNNTEEELKHICPNCGANLD